jgi:hypothetical protein
MDQDDTSPPRRAARPAAEIRREREAEALRANLRKRKDQQRARQAPTHGERTHSNDEPLSTTD